MGESIIAAGRSGDGEVGRSEMSKNNNVNPGQYKVAGRERQGEDIVQERQKHRLKQAKSKVRKAAGKKR